MDGYNQDLFFQTQNTFFDFQERAGETSPVPIPSSSCAPEIKLQAVLQKTCPKNKTKILKKTRQG